MESEVAGTVTHQSLSSTELNSRPDPSGQSSRVKTTSAPRPFAAMSTVYVYLVLALITVVPLVWLTPPFQVPDEPQHLFRAYELSEGHLRGTVENGAAGDFLPASLLELERYFLHSVEIHVKVRPVSATPLAYTDAAYKIRLDPAHREFADFSGAAFYSPLPYLPQTMAIAVGRSFGFGPLALLYSARLANALVAIFLVALSLRLLPVGRLPLFVIALLPMVLFEFASASADAATIGTAFLFTALAVRAQLDGRWTWTELIVAALAAITFCSLKPVYLPLLLIGLPAALQRRSARLLAINACLAGFVFAVTAAWLRFASSSLVLPIPGTSIHLQLQGMMHHPTHALVVLGHSAYWNYVYYFQSLIGRLGWLTIQLPTILYCVPVVAILVAILFPPAGDRPKFGRLAVVWYVLLMGVSLALVFVALYLTYTKVGESSVVGVQGLYFLPLGALFAALCAAELPTLKAGKRFPSWVVFALCGAEALAAVGVVVHRYSVLSGWRW